MSYFTPDVIAREQLEGAPALQIVAVVYYSYGPPFRYDSANWGAVKFYLEVYYKATSGTVHARLYNVTDSSAVTDSEVSTAQATYQRDRSLVLTLVDAKTYRVQFGKAGADAGKFLGAKLVVID